jgi:hypothetical protein
MALTKMVFFGRPLCPNGMFPKTQFAFSRRMVSPGPTVAEPPAQFAPACAPIRYREAVDLRPRPDMLRIWCAEGHDVVSRLGLAPQPCEVRSGACRGCAPSKSPSSSDCLMQPQHDSRSQHLEPRPPAPVSVGNQLGVLLAAGCLHGTCRTGQRRFREAKRRCKSRRTPERAF